MNKREYLLNLVMEEAAEITLAASKCKRFTDDHSYYEESNWERLQVEIRDLVTVLEMLSAHVGKDLNLSPDPEKVDRLEVYIHMSRLLGTLDG